MFETEQNIFDAAEAKVSEKDPKAEEKEPVTPGSSPEKAETPAGQEGDREQTPEDLKTSKEALHKDERFRRVVGDKNRYKRELDEARAELQKFKSAPAQQPQQQTNAKRPSWFTKFYGEGPEADEAWDGLQGMTASAKEQAKREALEEFKRESQSQSDEAKKWEGWVGEQLDALEEDGEDFDRNALQKFLTENPVVDSQGNLDFRKGLDLMRRLNPKTDNTTDKRKAGALATEKAKGVPAETKNKGVTPKDLQRLRNLGHL